MRPLRRIVLLCALLALLAAPLRPVRAGAAPLPSPAPLLARAIQTARAAAPATLRVNACMRVAEACVAVGRPDQARQALAYAEKAAFTPMGLANSSPVAVGREWLKLGFPADALKLATRLPLAGDRLDLTIAVADAFAAAGNRSKAQAALHAATAAYTPAVDPVLAVQALAAAASRSDPAAGRALLEQAAKIAAGMSSRDRDNALSEIAGAYGRLGDDAGATRTALQVRAPVAQASAMVATALELASQDEKAAVARVQQAASGAGGADPAPLSQAFTAAARRAADAGHKALARALLVAAERAGSRASGDARQTLLRNVAELYGTLLDDWAEALRVAQDAGDAWIIRAARAHSVVQLADSGQTQQADVLLRAAAADKVGYVGQTLLQKLAEAYLKINPKADTDAVMAVQPQALRDQVLAAGARRALAAGNPATALDWARHIGFSGAREEVLYQSACALVNNATAKGLAKALADARSVTALLRTDERRYGLLFAIGRRYASAGDMAAANSLIAEFDKPTHGGQQDSRSLARMAILEEAVGKKDEARTHLAKCLSTIDAISCGSCRELAIHDVLTDLLNFGDAALLDQTVKAGTAAGLPARLVVQLLDNLPHLSAARRRLVLHIGLQSAGKERLPVYGAEALAKMAVAYHEYGVTPEARDLAVLPAPPAPVVEAKVPVSVPTADKPAVLVYFHRTGCAECRDVSEMLNRIMAKTHNVKVTKYELDLADPKLKGATLLNETLCTALHVPKRDHQIAPAIFSSKGALIGREITEASLTGLIQAARGQPGPEQVYAVDRKVTEARLRSRYSSLGLLVVIGNGLIDGVNPCAFTVIIFFLSYLAFLGHNRREILAAGIFFTAANFLTYLAIGIFLAGVIRFGEARSAAFARALYGVTAALVLVAAALSLRDAIRCLQGRAKEMTLVLPEKFQSAIRRHITSRARFGLTAGAMAVLGGLVALISFPCTGQVYYPTILFGLHNLPQFRWGALGWLLIYNLCFILPLVVVFLLVFFGVTSERITAVFRRHLAATKFAMAGLFMVLFAIMLTKIP